MQMPTPRPAAPAPPLARAPKAAAKPRVTAAAKKAAAAEAAGGRQRKRRRRATASTDDDSEESDSEYRSDAAAGAASAPPPPPSVPAEGVSRPRRQAAQDAIVKADLCRSLERASGESFMLEAQQLARMKPPPSTSAPAVARTGEFDDKFIRLGEEYQVEVPGFDEASPPEDTYPGGRADVLVEIDFTPLDEPPPPVPIRTLKEVKAERAAKEAAEREAALRGSEGGAESDEDLDDFDEAVRAACPARTRYPKGLLHAAPSPSHSPSPSPSHAPPHARTIARSPPP